MRVLALLGFFVGVVCVAQLSSMTDPAKALAMPLALLQQASVQKEIRMTGAQKSAIKKLVDDLAKEGRTPNASFTQLSNAINDTNRKAIETLDEQQRVRFYEVRYQVLGLRCLSEPEVQAALTLTEEQKAAVKEFEKAEVSGMMREAQKGPTAMGNWQKQRGKREAEFAKMLTPEQADKLKTLYGKAFKDADKIAGR